MNFITALPSKHRISANNQSNLIVLKHAHIYLKYDKSIDNPSMVLCRFHLKIHRASNIVLNFALYLDINFLFTWLWFILPILQNHS